MILARATIRVPSKNARFLTLNCPLQLLYPLEIHHLTDSAKHSQSLDSQQVDTEPSGEDVEDSPSDVQRLPKHKARTRGGETRTCELTDTQMN